MVVGGLVGASCLCIAAGIYTLVRHELPPVFLGVYRRPRVLATPPSAVRRWGIGLLVFGIILATLTFLSTTIRVAA